MRIEEFEALVGKPIGTSDWIVVDQDRIDKFATATEDFEPIHVDPDAARKLPFGQTIAHGFLSLSLLAPFYNTGVPRIDGRTYGLNYGLNRVRFLAPVRSGKRVRGHFRLLALAQRGPGDYQFTMEVSVEIEGEEKPALIAEWITFASVQPDMPS